MSKYFSQRELDQLVNDVEREIDERARQADTDARLAKIMDYLNDPRNKAIIDADPTVQSIRRSPSAGSTPGAAPSTPAPATPRRPMTRSELEAQRPWLRPAKPSTKLVDPYVR